MPKLDYFRDIPNKEASAGDAAYLYYHRNGSFRKIYRKYYQQLYYNYH